MNQFKTEEPYNEVSNNVRGESVTSLRVRLSHLDQVSNSKHKGKSKVSYDYDDQGPGVKLFVRDDSGWR